MVKSIINRHLWVKTITPDRLWILFAWLPFWVFNIMGEEIFWRGIILPNQEINLGSKASLFHSAGWFIFHLSFGIQLLITLIPIILILPYVVQKRKNTWIGVLIHGGINGPGFIAVSFGLIQ